MGLLLAVGAAVVVAVLAIVWSVRTRDDWDQW